MVKRGAGIFLTAQSGAVFRQQVDDQRDTPELAADDTDTASLIVRE